MIKRPILGLLDIGGHLRYLLEREDGDYISYEGEEAVHSHGVKGVIEEFLKELDDYGLTVTTRAASRLRLFYDSIKERPVGSQLIEGEAEKLRDITFLLETTLSAEATGVYAFFATDKYISLEKLIDKHVDLFPTGVFDELSDIAKHDVREAGMCLAFERSTACAFHILRATEDALREFYCRIVRQNRVKKFMWGNMTSDLIKRRKRPSDIIMKNLDYIRENFRNPTAHPEARYDIDEARALFNLCIDVITRMIKDPLWQKK